MMTVEDLVLYVTTYKPEWKCLRSKIHQEFVFYLRKHTKFLDDAKVKRLSDRFRIMCVLEGITEVPKCRVCDNLVTTITTPVEKPHGYNCSFGLFCSPACVSRDADILLKKKDTCTTNFGVENPSQSSLIQEKMRITSIERYGVPNPMMCDDIIEKGLSTKVRLYGTTNPYEVPHIAEKIRQTSMDRYGHENPHKSEIVKSKTRRTNLSKWGYASTIQHPDIAEKSRLTKLSKYGTEFPQELESVKEKTRDTNIDRYGAASPFQAEWFKDKCRKTVNERYGVDHTSQSHWRDGVVDILNDPKALSSEYERVGTCIELAAFLGVSRDTVESAMKRYGIQIKRGHRSSIAEREISKFLEEHGIPHVMNDTSQIGSELDIYCDSYKVAIEFNGIYWHSDDFKQPDEHQNKSIACMKAGIRLFHIWEDDWIENRDDVLRKILDLFSNGKVLKNNDWLLASRGYNADDILTLIPPTGDVFCFVDLNVDNGAVLSECGFEVVQIIKPTKFWVYKNSRTVLGDASYNRSIHDAGGIIWRYSNPINTDTRTESADDSN